MLELMAAAALVTLAVGLVLLVLAGALVVQGLLWLLWLPFRLAGCVLVLPFVALKLVLLALVGLLLFPILAAGLTLGAFALIALATLVAVPFFLLWLLVWLLTDRPKALPAA